MKSLLHAACFALLVPASAAAQQPAASADDAAVRAAVGHYLQAHATGDGAHIRMAFHPALKLMWTVGDTLATRGAEEYAAGFRGSPAANEAQRRRWIESVDIGGTAAVAKVILDNPDRRFVDYLSLLKIDGEWKVVAKVFSSEAK